MSGVARFILSPKMPRTAILPMRNADTSRNTNYIGTLSFGHIAEVAGSTGRGEPTGINAISFLFPHPELESLVFPKFSGPRRFPQEADRVHQAIKQYSGNSDRPSQSQPDRDRLLIEIQVPGRHRHSDDQGKHEGYEWTEPTCDRLKHKPMHCPSDKQLCYCTRNNQVPRPVGSRFIVTSIQRE
jgi:hypothetical protein